MSAVSLFQALNLRPPTACESSLLTSLMSMLDYNEESEQDYLQEHYRRLACQFQNRVQWIQMRVHFFV